MPNTGIQSTPASWPTLFRPIAPNPSPPTKEADKRKWDIVQDYDVIGDGTISDESNNSQPLATDQRKRRKEQNRAAQRAFRERKERYVKELEEKIKTIQAAHEAHVTQLQNENKELRMVLQDMKLRLDSRDNESDESGEQDSPGVVATEKCIRDKDGVSFCERLKKVVCTSAYDQLLSEPLFDSAGTLNHAVTKNRVPIVSEPMADESENEDKQSVEKRFDSFAQRMSERLEQTLFPDIQSSGKLIPCSTAWKRMSSHPRFDSFNLDDLCDQLKRKAKCSENGPVFEEEEIEIVIKMMDQPS
ncbi:hypothetical protein CLU79DRAFT_775239 [Phycomyces nitens]|nr:hypothetical protein CLU79DRAFT_775239 [Phycomyces nitens]